jgi:hypothetical protein
MHRKRSDVQDVQKQITSATLNRYQQILRPRMRSSNETDPIILSSSQGVENETNTASFHFCAIQGPPTSQVHSTRIITQFISEPRTTRIAHLNKSTLPTPTLPSNAAQNKRKTSTVVSGSITIESKRLVDTEPPAKRTRSQQHRLVSDKTTIDLRSKAQASASLIPTVKKISKNTKKVRISPIESCNWNSKPKSHKNDTPVVQVVTPHYNPVTRKIQFDSNLMSAVRNNRVSKYYDPQNHSDLNDDASKCVLPMGVMNIFYPFFKKERFPSKTKQQLLLMSSHITTYGSNYLFMLQKKEMIEVEEINQFKPDIPATALLPINIHTQSQTDNTKKLANCDYTHSLENPKSMNDDVSIASLPKLDERRMATSATTPTKQKGLPTEVHIVACKKNDQSTSMGNNPRYLSNRSPTHNNDSTSNDYSDDDDENDTPNVDNLLSITTDDDDDYEQDDDDDSELYEINQTMVEERKPIPIFNQPMLTTKMRMMLAQWMSEVCEEFKLSDATYHLSITLLDQLLLRGPTSHVYIRATYSCPDVQKLMIDNARNSKRASPTFLINRQDFQAIGWYVLKNYCT